MYGAYFVAVCLLGIASSAVLQPQDLSRMNALMNPPDKDVMSKLASVLSAKDTMGHFPEASSNTVYPGMMPPGYQYTRRVRARIPNVIHYPAPSYQYTRRVRTSVPNYVQYPSQPTYYRRRTTYNNNNGFPWMWYYLSDNM